MGEKNHGWCTNSVSIVWRRKQHWYDAKIKQLKQNKIIFNDFFSNSPTWKWRKLSRGTITFLRSDGLRIETNTNRSNLIWKVRRFRDTGYEDIRGYRGFRGIRFLGTSFAPSVQVTSFVPSIKWSRVQPSPSIPLNGAFIWSWICNSCSLTNLPRNSYEGCILDKMANGRKHFQPSRLV